MRWVFRSYFWRLLRIRVMHRADHPASPTLRLRFVSALEASLFDCDSGL